MSNSPFVALKKKVFTRGVPPDEFLWTLINWANEAEDSIFDKNDNPADIYALIRPELGPWKNIKERKAAMLEAMRVHAGFESSWNWKEGVDRTNRTSMANIEGQETGVFQVSFDSTYIDHRAMQPFARNNGIGTPEAFIVDMKSNHTLALEYYARLVRVNIQWAGPLKRKEVLPWLSRPAMEEFENFLK